MVGPIMGTERFSARDGPGIIAGVIGRGATIVRSGSAAGVLVAVLTGTAALGAADTKVARPETRVAVFEFELIDYSRGGTLVATAEDPAETRRLDLLTGQLREAIAAAPGFGVVDIAPVAAEAAERNLQHCGNCDVSFADRLDADWSVTGTVQKVSNLILNINVYVKDVDTGEMLQAMSADIRGNTNQSWQRGLAWLIRNRLSLKIPE
ncbi:DUF3280 domain-containing protein [Acuticoccus sediminis]|nr:DUF3280 domain-containing protein [Acuticoccus sediminis]